jgi:hypothetical protein
MLSSFIIIIKCYISPVGNHVECQTQRKKGGRDVRLFTEGGHSQIFYLESITFRCNNARTPFPTSPRYQIKCYQPSTHKISKEHDIQLLTEGVFSENPGTHKVTFPRYNDTTQFTTFTLNPDVIAWCSEKTWHLLSPKCFCLRIIP